MFAARNLIFLNQAQKIERDMEGELDELIQHRRNLEIHILRTQNWCENQGSWRAAVYEAQVSIQKPSSLMVPSPTHPKSY